MRPTWLLLLFPALSAAADLIVRVTDPLGEPLHGAAVELNREGESGDRVRLTPRTGRDGRCRFSGLEPGVYHLQARPFRGWRGEAARRVEITSRQDVVATTLTTGRTRAYRISGVVEQLGRGRLAQPAVFFDRVERAEPHTPYEPCRATLIQADGSFRVSVRTPGEYRLFVGELLAGSQGCARGKPATPQTLFVGEDVRGLRLRAE